MRPCLVHLFCVVVNRYVFLLEVVDCLLFVFGGMYVFVEVLKSHKEFVDCVDWTGGPSHGVE